MTDIETETLAGDADGEIVPSSGTSRAPMVRKTYCCDSIKIHNDVRATSTGNKEQQNMLLAVSLFLKKPNNPLTPIFSIDKDVFGQAIQKGLLTRLQLDDIRGLGHLESIAIMAAESLGRINDLMTEYIRNFGTEHETDPTYAGFIASKAQLTASLVASQSRIYEARQKLVALDDPGGPFQIFLTEDTHYRCNDSCSVGASCKRLAKKSIVHELALLM